jgi:hypothetical protein
VYALDATQCEPKRLDAYVGFSRDGEGLPKLVLVSRGRVAATSPRQDLGALTRNRLHSSDKVLIAVTAGVS